jgi:hypothetical protein
MKLIQFSLVLALSLLLSSCALNYFYIYQPDQTKTGKALFIPTGPTSNTYVTLNDSLIIENKYLKSLTLENLPNGDYSLHYTSLNNGYKEKLDKYYLFKIENGTQKVEVVAVPPMSSGYWIYAGLVSASIYAILLLGR